MFMCVCVYERERERGRERERKKERERGRERTYHLFRSKTFLSAICSGQVARDECCLSEASGNLTFTSCLGAIPVSGICL